MQMNYPKDLNMSQKLSTPLGHSKYNASDDNMTTPLSYSQDNKLVGQLIVSATAVAEGGTETCKNSLHELQLADGIIMSILTAKEFNCKPEVESLNGLPQTVCQLLQLWDQLVLNNGLLYRRFEDWKGKGICL